MINKKLQDVNRINEIKGILDEYNIHVNNVCVVRGLALEAIGLRKAKDIDLCLDLNLYCFLEDGSWNVVENPSRCFVYSKNSIDFVSNYYKELIGISDNEIIYDSRYHFELAGLKFIRPELVFATKAIRQRPHDICDLELLTEYAKENPSKWDWQLVKDPVYRSKPKKDWCYHEKEELWAASKLMIPPEMLLGLQFLGCEFNAVDTIVRYIAIDDYLNGKSEGINLYKKMQIARVYKEGWVDFQKLIDGIRLNGFQQDCPIEVDTSGTLINGSHRLACSLYFNLPLIPINCVKREFNRDYRIKWFERSGFSTDEIEQINKSQKKLLTIKGVYFTAVLWPPIYPFFDEIQKMINNHFQVISKKEVCLTDADFIELVRKIGGTDDIDEWKLMRKTHFLCSTVNQIRFLQIQVPRPTYRKKEQGKILCIEMEKLKFEIRQAYKCYLDNYISDIIIHISDNPTQSLNLNKIIEDL